jgi:hypothetical protein
LILSSVGDSMPNTQEIDANLEKIEVVVREKMLSHANANKAAIDFGTLLIESVKKP